MTKQNLKDHTQKEHADDGDSGGFSAINNRTGTGETDSTIGQEGSFSGQVSGGKYYTTLTPYK